jgi:hypothetical protein
MVLSIYGMIANISDIILEGIGEQKTMDIFVLPIL